jgi:hypothetical protein
MTQCLLQVVVAALAALDKVTQELVFTLVQVEEVDLADSVLTRACQQVEI